MKEYDEVLKMKYLMQSTSRIKIYQLLNIFKCFLWIVLFLTCLINSQLWQVSCSYHTTSWKYEIATNIKQ